MYMTKWID